MGISVAVGSICFGVVIGWITYFTMRKNTKPRTLSDITVIISALVGPAILGSGDHDERRPDDLRICLRRVPVGADLCLRSRIQRRVVTSPDEIRVPP